MLPDRSTLAIIKACAFGAVLLVLYLWARGTGVEAEHKRGAAAIAVCEADRATLTNTLNEVNAIAFTAKQGAAEMALRADHAVKAAEVDKADYLAHIDAVTAELIKAKRTTVACRAQLEAELCVPLQ
jgi:hypothetical protein